MDSQTCMLHPLDKSHDPIDLPNKQAVTIGRNPRTRIMDTLVSRQHVRLTADYEKRNVSIEVIGSSIWLEDQCESIQRGSTIIIDEDSRIQLLDGKYLYRIKFHKSRPERVITTPKKNSEERSHKTHRSPDKQQHSITSFFNSKSKKRPAMEDNDQSNANASKKAKTVTQAASDSDEDDEHMREVKERLKRMKDDLKGVKTESIKPATEKTPAILLGKRGPPAEETKWYERDTLLTCVTKGVCSSEKIAGFDIDGCIICTASGKVFATHPGDWRILYPEIPGTLKRLNKEGYKIVFFTNQMGIQRGKVKKEDFKQKAENIIRKIGVPVQLCASTGAGPYRKPGLGMWKYVKDETNDGISVVDKECIYVGDAAGRPKDWAPGKKKDFSCSDRLFALNAGLKFQTPEEFFLKHKAARFDMPSFDPRKLDESVSLCEPNNSDLTSDRTEVVIFTGPPAAGKSFIAKQYMIGKGYVHVNRDTLKTWQKCVQATEVALAKGKSVVVDNTNPDTESRKRYITVAKKYKFREMTDKSHQTINDMIIHSYFTKEQDPTKDEGFSEIVKINFVPKFDDDKLEKLYRTFLLDK